MIHASDNRTYIQYCTNLNFYDLMYVMIAYGCKFEFCEIHEKVNSIESI